MMTRISTNLLRDHGGRTKLNKKVHFPLHVGTVHEQKNGIALGTNQHFRSPTYAEGIFI